MRKSFMVSEPSTPHELLGFVSQVRWSEPDAQQRREGDVAQKATMAARAVAPTPA